MNIFNDCLNRRFSYKEIKEQSKIDLLDDFKYNINVIVGFRNRTKFLKPLINSFKNAIKNSSKKICLTFVEHDVEPKHQSLLNNEVNYIWTLGNNVSQYSRSFAYNFGVKYSNRADYYLLHDVDILVKKNFFTELEENLNSFRCLQPYGNRHILYMSEELTNNVIDGKQSIDDESIKSNVSAPDLKGSKGGSILISRDLFFEVGGFDPEIFWGYAAEDQLFWDKVSTITNIGYADNPSIDMFHMWHEPMSFTNPFLFLMDKYMYEFRSMNHENKMCFLNMKNQFLND